MGFADGKAGECKRKRNPKNEYLIFTTNGMCNVFVVFILGRKMEAIIGGKWGTGNSFKNMLRFLIRDT